MLIHLFEYNIAFRLFNKGSINSANIFVSNAVRVDLSFGMLDVHINFSVRLPNNEEFALIVKFIPDLDGTNAFSG